MLHVFQGQAVALAALLSACASVQFCSAQHISWADSYEINGVCYCDSSFDHDIGTKYVPGPCGEDITVFEACALIGDGPEGDRIYYNDIQCGNGPPNDHDILDEIWCPGRVDLGNGVQDGCADKGPVFQFPDGSCPGALFGVLH